MRVRCLIFQDWIFCYFWSVRGMLKNLDQYWRSVVFLVTTCTVCCQCSFRLISSFVCVHMYQMCNTSFVLHQCIHKTLNNWIESRLGNEMDHIRQNVVITQSTDTIVFQSSILGCMFRLFSLGKCRMIFRKTIKSWRRHTLNWMNNDLHTFDALTFTKPCSSYYSTKMRIPLE